MTRENPTELLRQLRDLLVQERRLAKAMDLEGMRRVQLQKEALLPLLEHAADLDEEGYRLAREVKEENLRNAYLFRFTLRWIQDVMGFFGRKSSPVLYAPTGRTVHNSSGGRLLSGRV